MISLRELEDGIELSAQSEKSKLDRKQQSWSKPSDKSDHEDTQHGRHQDHADDHLEQNNEKKTKHD